MWALAYLIPHLSPRRYFFAITVAPDFPSSEPGCTILRRFYLRMTAAAVLTAWPLAEAAGRMPVAGPMVAILGPMTIAMVLYLMGRNEVRPHSVSNGAIREASLSTSADHLPRWILLTLPPFAAPIAAAAWLRAHWDELPQRFPVHFDLNGVPNRWAEKSARGVYGPPLIEAGLMLLILLLGLAMFYGARRGPQRSAVLKIQAAAIYFIAYIFTLVSMLPVKRPGIAFTLVPTLVFTIAVLAWCFKMAGDPDMPVDSTPDDHWKLGSIYYNPADPVLFVQKRIGFGYTLNFGNPVSWISLGVFVALLAAVLVVLR
jgi:uncharacterized membrane protein